MPGYGYIDDYYPFLVTFNDVEIPNLKQPSRTPFASECANCMTLPSRPPISTVYLPLHLSSPVIIHTSDPFSAKGQLERHAYSQHAQGRNNHRILTRKSRRCLIDGFIICV